MPGKERNAGQPGGARGRVVGEDDRSAELRRLNRSLREEIRSRRSAEDALRKAERNFRNLINSSADGIIVTDVRGVVRFSNHAAEALFEKPAVELEGRVFGYPLVQPGDSAELDILREGEVAFAEMRVSETEWGGEPCLLLALRDITERRRTQQELDRYRRQLEQLVAKRTESLQRLNAALRREVAGHKRTQVALERSERLYHTTVDQLTDMVHVVDRELRILLFNTTCSRVCEELGSDQEAVGRHVFDVFPFLPDSVRDEYAQVFRGGELLVTREETHIGGRQIITETRKIPISDGDTIDRVITVVRDITEQKLAEDALRESEERHRHLFENIPTGVFRTTPFGEIVEANEALCQLLGYPDRESLKGVTVTDTYVSASDRARLRALLAEQGMIQSYETLLRRRDGSITHAAIDARAFHDSTGCVRYYEGTVQDISERKRAEAERERLVQTDKLMMLGTLVSGVAHEVNNPNNFIMLNTPVLEQVFRACLPLLDQRFRESGDFVIGKMRYSRVREKLPRLLEGILSGSRRIGRIVDELRSFSRPEMAGVSEEVNISDVVDAAVSLTSSLIAKSTMQFTVKRAERIPTIRGSFQRLEQVIINLLQNACQSLPDRTRAVTIAASVDDERQAVLITVEDEGVGIPAESVARVTEPFFTTKRSVGGTGLGLAVSARIVEEHGGTLCFASQQGVGTVATVSLPFPDAEAGTTEEGR